MYDMTIELKAGTGKRLYEQIYEHIRQEIREGRLLAGERLPSARSLAEYLQVSRSTVDTAYEQLLSEGYIESRPCRGYFVCHIEDLFQMEKARGPREQKAVSGASGTAGKHLPGSRVVPGKNAPGTAALASPGEDRSLVCDFSPNEIEMSAFPFNVWMRITKNILSGSNSRLFSQGEPQGEPELRRTICKYLHASRGVECDPEQIIIGAGNDYLLLLLEKILGSPVRIAMENPTYKRAYQILRSFAEIAAVDMDKNGMLADRLEQENADVAYVMPSHQFPTGIVMPIGRRAELLNWANAAENRYLIEDDYDSEFRYRGKPIPSLQASDRHGKVIYIGTFSKAIAPAIRISYMVLPYALLERYQRDCYFYSSTVSRIDQRILNEFIQNGHFERHLNKMRKIYRARHELLLEELQAFKGMFRISGENAGLHLLLTARGKISEEDLLQKAAKQGVRVYGMSDYHIDAAALPRFYRETSTLLVGYGGLNEKQIQEGTGLLKKAWL